MIRFKDIQIPKPCSVVYDELPGDEIKRFCGSCEKHVYDFRGKDESYLNTIFNQTGNVCGIYDKHKINSSYTCKPSLHQRTLNKLFALGLLLKSVTVQAENATTEIPVKVLQTAVEKDSTNTVKTTIKGKQKNRFGYDISIYIDNELYQDHAHIENRHLYLPDSIGENQVVKIIVHNKIFFRKKLRIKQRTYRFKWKDAEKVNIKIIYKQYLITLKKRTKREHIMGLLKK